MNNQERRITSMNIEKFIGKVKALTEQELGVEIDIKIIAKSDRAFKRDLIKLGFPKKEIPKTPIRGYAGRAMDKLNEIWVIPENFKKHGESVKLGIVRTLSHELFHVFQARVLMGRKAYDDGLEVYEKIIRNSEKYFYGILKDGDEFVKIEAEAHRFMNDFNKTYFPKLVSKTLE
jgi:hypothetical protein